MKPILIFSLLFFFACGKNDPPENLEREKKEPSTIEKVELPQVKLEEPKIHQSSASPPKEKTIFEIRDNNGQSKLRLSEHSYQDERGQRCQDTLKAFYSSLDEKKVIWQMQDFIRKERTKDLDEEYDIQFLQDYINTKDLDEDGYSDIILVYATKSINGWADGRLKVLIYYKGQKIAIRHQNGVLDFQRNISIDTEFYELPVSIQNHVVEQLKKIEKEYDMIIPYGWDEGIKQKKNYVDEND